MSRGPGIVERRIAQAILSNTQRPITVEAAAKAAYPSISLEPKHLDVASRALNRLVPKLGLRKEQGNLPDGKGSGYFYQIESVWQSNQAEAQQKLAKLQAALSKPACRTQSAGD